MSKALYDDLDRIGRIRLSQSYFMRDFLHSEIAAAYNLANLPDELDLAVEAGAQLCEQLLEPLQAQFGRLHIRSAYRSCTVNAFGNANGLNCSRNEANYADHIWDRRDDLGRMGATACVVVPAFSNVFSEPGDWTELAWWINDQLPYSSLCFFPKRWAVNVQWREVPERRITSYTGWQTETGWKRSGLLTKGSTERQPAQYARLSALFAQ